MLISPAYADAAAGPAGAFGFEQMLPLILVFAVFYFLLIRPQQKRAKEHKAVLAGIKRGDRIVTGGGLVATVVKTTDDEVTVEIAENVKVHVMRDTVIGLYREKAAVPPPAEAKADGTPEEKPALGSKLKRLLGGK